MCRQSVDEPWRTIKALVNAANDIVIAAIPTQIALLDGGGEYSWTPSKFPSGGAKFRQPPLPEFPASPRAGRRRTLVLGGSWTVVAITSRLSLFSFQYYSRISALISLLHPRQFAPVSSA